MKELTPAQLIKLEKLIAASETHMQTYTTLLASDVIGQVPKAIRDRLDLSSVELAAMTTELQIASEQKVGNMKVLASNHVSCTAAFAKAADSVSSIINMIQPLSVD